jgi:Domain of unknown function (DUF4160)
MGSIKVRQLRLVVYGDDHPPPHTHVLGPGWEIRITLTNPPALMTVAGSAKKTDAKAALIAVHSHLAALQQLWSAAHDQSVDQPPY